ncbi:hypothetical protein J5N97_023169 [Dioscorea zingiberensis]|uniref:Ataxin-2 C-terminal domain-containing protein n=1 Tax=Dioscorea zingiberensis TaxID=325984 RepID=A0A9D5HBI5_9LILI|nr:hypothetical protein J5N97_023169 [Dioscorea zingiberensis]
MPSAVAMSTLNPNAAPFVPSAYRSVEDYSDEWWALVRSTPWFRDYWLRECFLDEHAGDSDFDLLEFDDPLSDAEADDLFHSFPCPHQEEEKTRMELKVSPRMIQQPR